MRIYQSGFLLLNAMMGCAIVALIAIIIMIWFTPGEPSFTPGRLDTLCVNHVRIVVDPYGKFRQLLDQWGRGVACE